MARVRAFTSILRHYPNPPEFLAGNTGPGTIYPFGGWDPNDSRWDLFSAMCARVRAWRYTYSGHVNVSYEIAGTTTEYTYTDSGSQEEEPVDFEHYPSVAAPGDTAGAIVRPTISSPEVAVASEKAIAHPFAVIRRTPAPPLTTGTVTWEETPFGSSGSLTGVDASAIGGFAQPDFREATVSALASMEGRLVFAPCLAVPGARYFALDAIFSMGNNPAAPPPGLDLGYWNRGDFSSALYPDGGPVDSERLLSNFTCSTLRTDDGMQVGTLTILWHHPHAGLQTVSTPLYTPDPLGERASHPGERVLHAAEYSLHVTMQPAVVAPYGHDPDNPLAHTFLNPIYDPVTGAALADPFAP